MLSQLRTNFPFFATSAAPIPLSNVLPIQGNESRLRRNDKINYSTDILHTRDRLEVYANMLEAAIKCGIKKFDILYEA